MILPASFVIEHEKIQSAARMSACPYLKNEF